MDILDKNIIEQNQIISKECLMYKKALGLAIEGLKNIEVFDNTNISNQTIKEINKILNNK